MTRRVYCVALLLLLGFRDSQITSPPTPSSLSSELRPWGVEIEAQLKPYYPLMRTARAITGLDALHSSTSAPLGGSYTGNGILIGIVDTEFDTHHPAFLDSSGRTRFVALWDQTRSALRQNRFNYGVIKRGDELRVDSLFGLGEESHGTIVASYAAGYDKSVDFRGAAPGAMLIGVRRSYSDSNIVDGIRWIFSVADSLKVPCVVNLSIGSQVGPHDGTSYIDRQIDLISGPGRIVVGAIGNDFEKRVHASWTIVQGEERGSWAIPGTVNDSGGNRYFSRVEMWGESGKPFSVNLWAMDTITRQRRILGQLSLPLSLRYRIDSLTWVDSVTETGEPIQLYTAAERSNPANRRPHAFVVLVGKNPHLVLGTTVISSATSTTIHAWNVSKETFKSFGMPGFVDGDTVMTLCEVGGTAKRIITAGAHYAASALALWNGEPYGTEKIGHPILEYSGSGPTLDGRIKPDISVPGAHVVGALNRKEINNRVVIWPDTAVLTRRYAVTGGTSISAPILSGIVALMLQVDPTLTPERVRQILQETARRDEHTGPLPTPDNRWGAGKVDAFAAVSKLLGVQAHPMPVASPSRPAEFSVTMRGRSLFLEGQSSRAGEQLRFIVFDASGRKVHLQRIEGRASVVSLPQHLSKGFFVITVEDLQGRRLWSRSLGF